MNIQTLLVGVNFRPASAKSTVKFLKTDDELRLVRDADNPYDINAVQVWKDHDTQDGMEPDWIGFIARNDAATIAPIMDGGAEVTCKVIHNNGPKEVHLLVEYSDDAVGVPATDLPSFKPADNIDDEVSF